MNVLFFLTPNKGLHREILQNVLPRHYPDEYIMGIDNRHKILLHRQLKQIFYIRIQRYRLIIPQTNICEE